ncbi:FKBP-type peptidyl-prolyl cis-trans isomerase [Wenyingzhuangia sp. IMCC45467]
MKFSWLFVYGILFVSCNHTKARRPINKKNDSSKYEYSILLNKTIQAEEENNIKKYIVNDTLLNYNFSPYGFAYAKVKTSEVLKNKVQQNDIVTYVKSVFNLKNELIYREIQETIIVGKSKEIKGIEEGLKLMQEDEEFKFIFSSFVAHGFSGDGNNIGANTPIVVKIKLLKIK